MTFAEILQTALNKYLALDPESKLRLQALENKVVQIDLLSLKLSFQLIFLNKRIHLQLKDFQEPNTTIRGTPLRLLYLTLTHENRKKFFADDVSITGDLELGQDVIDLFDRLEIDWEEYLSHWIGDIPAYNLGKITRKIKHWNEKTRNTLLQNLNEYLHEEIDFFPTRESLQDFFQDVDELRLDTDRLEAKVKHLQKLRLKQGDV